ncbi:unnamed protein product [Lathyrus oleraceus]|uniref:Uncharacterized protein n=1 Tax=Pisum sativum TaxID=3888 RepID=A0A9D4XK71_PEA|nr:hypothetical protein KIW84_045846 [Pisum sativum]
MTQLKLFSSGIEHASFATSYKILKKTWNVISSSHDYEGIVSNVGVGLCWKVFKEQRSDLTIIAFEATSDSSNLHSDYVSATKTWNHHLIMMLFIFINISQFIGICIHGSHIKKVVSLHMYFSYRLLCWAHSLVFNLCNPVMGTDLYKR